MTETSGPYDIGIVGAGTICREAHLPVLAALPRTDVRFVADLDADRARRATRGYETRALEVSTPDELPTCDVCVLAVPVGVREPYVEEFCGRGTPLFVEKPFAPDEATHRAFLDACEDVAMTCNYTRRWFAATEQLRTLVDAAPFGRLERVEFREDHVGPTNVSPGSYRLDPELSGGGILVEKGCHALGQLEYVLEGYDLRVDRASFVWADDLDVEVDARLRAVPGRADAAANPIPVDLTLSRVNPCGSEARFVFEDATVTFDPLREDARATVELPDVSRRSGMAFAPDDEWATSFLQGIARKWRTFLRELNDGDPWDDGRRAAATGIDVSRLISAAYERERSVRRRAAT